MRWAMGSKKGGGIILLFPAVTDCNGSCDQILGRDLEPFAPLVELSARIGRRVVASRPVSSTLGDEVSSYGFLRDLPPPSLQRGDSSKGGLLEVLGRLKTATSLRASAEMNAEYFPANLEQSLPLVGRESA